MTNDYNQNSESIGYANRETGKMVVANNIIRQQIYFAIIRDILSFDLKLKQRKHHCDKD